VPLGKPADSTGVKSPSGEAGDSLSD